MTEIEVAQLEAEVFTHEPDPVVELQWTREQIAKLREQESSLMAAFRLWQFMRDDQNMKGTVGDLRTCRAKLSHLATRETVLQEK